MGVRLKGGSGNPKKLIPPTQTPLIIPAIAPGGTSDGHLPRAGAAVDRRVMREVALLDDESPRRCGTKVLWNAVYG